MKKVGMILLGVFCISISAMEMKEEDNSVGYMSMCKKLVMHVCVNPHMDCVGHTVGCPSECTTKQCICCMGLTAICIFLGT